MNILPIIFLSMSALAVAAQDMPSQYRTAKALFGYSAVGNEPEVQLPEIDEMISAITGNWVPLSVVFPSDEAIPTAENWPTTVAKFCDRVPSHFQRLSAHSFTMARDTRPKDGPPSTQTTILQFVGGTTFLKFTDEAGMMNRVGIDPNDSAKAANVGIVLRSMGGYVSVLHPSADILVLLPLGSSAEIWGRCR